MKRWKWLLLSGLGACLILALALPAHAEGHKYVGPDTCKMCHNSPAKGAQYTKWSESKHAKAYEVLGSDEAKKIAQAKGIADPQKADDCLKCHVTTHGVAADLIGDKVKIEQGVTCESCHGPGGDYKSMAVMKDHAKAAAAGLMDPNEETCKKCHNSESPTFKSFDFAAASAAIAHPNPKKSGGK